MPVRGLVELTPDLEPESIADLVRVAQRVSTDGRVVLVVYDLGPDEPLLTQAREAEFVIADSGPLSASLLSNGIRHMRAREGLRYLRSLAQQALKAIGSERFATATPISDYRGRRTNE